MGVSNEMVSAGMGTGAGDGADVEESVDAGSLEEEELESAFAGGSGRCSELDMLQRGQTQSRDLVAGEDGLVKCTDVVRGVQPA